MFVWRGASILHADLDSFFASVEQRDDPRLLGRPVIVGMGVVLAASYEAKAFGVRTAMGERRARALCPQAVVVRPRMSAYSEASKAVFRVFEDTSPVVEGLSIDEAFLDVSGMERSIGSPAEIAARLRERVRDQVGLPITVGVARTKFLAKVASAVAKPDGLLVVPPDDELAFLHPAPRRAPVGRRPGDGAEAARARDHDRAAGGDAPRVRARLDARAGVGPPPARTRAQPRPAPRPRASGAADRSARSARADVAPWSPASVDADLVTLVDRVTRRMRTAGRTGRTVVLRLRFDDYSRATRSHTLPYATASTERVLETARALLATAVPTLEQRGLTLVGIAVANLDDATTRQLMLPVDARENDALDAVLDLVRDRFGTAAITRAVLLGRSPGLTMPLLPD